MGGIDMKRYLTLVLLLALCLTACTPEAPAETGTRPGSSARRDTPGSISFVPGAAGLVLAAAVVRELGQF